jgi:uncharacterized protein (DUF1501 family)
MQRRKFCQQAAILTGASLIPVGVSGWVARGVAQTPNPKRLIVIFLRGAVDGLNVVVPYQEPDYYEARPTLALPIPGEAKGVLDLGGNFGLNPVLSKLMPLWQQKSLAFVHACGSPDPTRSHFEAQDYMENGTPGQKKTRGGWMNRLLADLPKGTPTQAINLGSTTPLILSGSMPVANLPIGKKAERSLEIDRPEIQSAFDRLYSGNDELSRAYQEGKEARNILLTELRSEMMNSAKGAPLPDTLASEARKLAQLMVGDARTQLAFLALGGWDTHVNQDNQLTRNLHNLAEGLTTLVRELGSVYSQTVIVVMSEFGRTVRENGNRGTDHGHGNLMWLLGGQIRGGKVYGQWPGLEESRLFEGRDLAITTDFRDVLSAVLQTHLHISDDRVQQIFPGFVPSQTLPLL